MKQLFAFCTLISMATNASAQEPQTFDLGGPRKATATVKQTDDDYEIRVSLIPVRCFDPALNRQLSQAKAQSYAREALLRHLGGRKKQSATISRAEVMEAGNVDSRFVLVLRVPLKSVRLTEATEAKVSQAKPPKSLLKAKDDYEETLDVITTSLTDELLAFNGNSAKFYEAVGAAEELGVTRLAALSKDIKADRWLLSTECDELCKAVAVTEERFLNRLRQRVEEFERQAKEAK